MLATSLRQPGPLNFGNGMTKVAIDVAIDWPVCSYVPFIASPARVFATPKIRGKLCFTYLPI